MPVNAYARFAVEMRSRVLSDEVLHHARHCLNDWSAATLPGSVLAPASTLLEVLDEEIGHGGGWDGSERTIRTAPRKESAQAPS